MVFSVNQFRHLYVAKSKATVNESAAVGAIEVAGNDDHVYFKYMGAGGQMRSDLIKLDNILYAKATDASKMARTLKAVKVTIDNNPVAGQDYILKIKYNQFIGLSDEDNYFEYGEVHATTGMTKAQFYAKLAISLAKNTAKQGLVTIKCGSTVVTPDTKESALSTAADVTIVEKEQDWVLGTKEQTPVFFEVFDTPIMNAGDEVNWATIASAASGVTINNGKTIADLEYFCMGERGDIYRNVGWPNSIPTKYLVDPTKAYYVFDIHYAFVGANEAVQKSEKDITIVCDSKTTLNGIIGDFNTATGLSIDTLA